MGIPQAWIYCGLVELGSIIKPCSSLSGTPIVTLPGDTLASRVASSLVTALGFPELIAQSRQDYVDKVVFYATNKIELRRLQKRVRIARKTSPLFNTKILVSNLEQAYRAMWQQHVKEGRPAHLDVKPSSISHESL